jgi:hypothetical protein
MSKSLWSLAALACLLGASAWLGAPAAGARASNTAPARAAAPCCDSVCPLCAPAEPETIHLDCCAEPDASAPIKVTCPLCR